MLASVSNAHSIHNSYNFQNNVADTNQHANKLEKTEENNISSESSRLAQEATQSQQDQQKIQQLKSRDLEVKTHEQAHLSAAGSLANGGASFTYSKGPNGINYAGGGEVNIDTSPVNGDPAATLRKADTIRRAAMAPANPSSQDQRVAAKATAMAEKARADLVQLTQEDKDTKIAKKTETDTHVDNTDEKKSNSSTEPNPEAGSLLDISV